MKENNLDCINIQHRESILNHNMKLDIINDIDKYIIKAKTNSDIFFISTKHKCMEKYLFLLEKGLSNNYGIYNFIETDGKIMLNLIFG